jgi:hypothetical protein
LERFLFDSLEQEMEEIEAVLLVVAGRPGTVCSGDAMVRTVVAVLLR